MHFVALQPDAHDYSFAARLFAVLSFIRISIRFGNYVAILPRKTVCVFLILLCFYALNAFFMERFVCAGDTKRRFFIVLCKLYDLVSVRLCFVV